MSDTVLARGSSAKYQSHPEGQFVGQCVDVIDLGDKVEEFPGTPKKLVPKCALVYRTGEKNGETGEYIDIAREFTISMGDKSNLRKYLEQWRGKPYSADVVAQGVPLHKLTGQHGLLTIAHKTSGQGRTYANIVSCVGIPKQMAGAVTIYGDYKRADYWAQRKADYAAAAQVFRAASAAPPDESDDEFPDALRDGDDDLAF